MAQFQVGKVYTTRSACDYDCIFGYKVIARTAKQITMERNRGDVVKRGVFLIDGVEYCKPEGTYSMCPVISAN
jgi:hypothetical protein